MSLSQFGDEHETTNGSVLACQCPRSARCPGSCLTSNICRPQRLAVDQRLLGLRPHPQGSLQEVRRRHFLVDCLGALAVPRLASASPRLVTVIGDSHGHGVAIGLNHIGVEVFVNDIAVGGTGSWQMPTAPDDGNLVVVSAGTVDCGTRDPDDKMVTSLLRVLGAYVDGPKKGGRLVYVVPHDRLRGRYAYVNPRITKLNEMMHEALKASTSLVSVSMLEDPGPDGIHLDFEGYKHLAQRCLEAV